MFLFNSINIIDVAAGLLINLTVGCASYWKQSVTLSGCISGIVTGLCIYIFGGPLSWALLFCFFLSSSVLSRYGRAMKTGLESVQEKPGRRDHIQVLANCLVGAVMAVLYHYTGSAAFLAGIAVSFASANADTWASEIGVLSRNDPVSIITMKPVPRGSSGGVSPLGLIASLAGSFFIAMVFVAGSWIQGQDPALLAPAALLVTAAGFLGSIIDSLLGATVQAQYLCPETGSFTEKKVLMGRATQRVRGMRLIDNDMVNLLSCALSVSIAVSLFASYPLFTI